MTAPVAFSLVAFASMLEDVVVGEGSYKSLVCPYSFFFL